MRRSLSIFLRKLLFAILGLLSLPPVVYGAYLLWCFLRIHTADLYYADYPYLSAALAFLGLGALSFWTTFYAVWRRSFYGLFFVVPVFVGLATMVLVPNLVPHGFSSVADTNYLSSVTAFFVFGMRNITDFPLMKRNSEKRCVKAQQRGNIVWKVHQQASMRSEAIFCHTK